MSEVPLFDEKIRQLQLIFTLNFSHWSPYSGLFAEYLDLGCGRRINHPLLPVSL